MGGMGREGMGGGDGMGWDGNAPVPDPAGRNAGPASPRAGPGKPEGRQPHTVPTPGSPWLAPQEGVPVPEHPRMRCPAGPAISTWLCAIPRSATKALLGRTAQLEPAGMRSTRRMAVPQFPLGTLQRDRSAGDPSAHGGAAAAPQLGRATALLAPGHAAAPAPRRGWLWGGRSPSQPRHRTQAGKVHSQPSQTGTARVSRGRGERGRGCQC